jgi:flavin reductase (DIM6/NTAB) family NADH-FMN oxidoreductase RutF
MIIDYEQIKQKDRYKLMAGGIIPRPIAWILTKSSDNVINIAPFSYFTGLSSNPPTLIVSIGHKSDKTPKDTLKNIRQSKKCTLCIADEALLEPMHFSSKELPDFQSEAEVFDIKTEKILDEFPPIIDKVPLAFFCELYKEIDLKKSKTIPLILEIKKEYINENCIDKNLKTSYKPIARLGGEYAFLGKIINAPTIK